MLTFSASQRDALCSPLQHDLLFLPVFPESLSNDLASEVTRIDLISEMTWRIRMRIRSEGLKPLSHCWVSRWSSRVSSGVFLPWSTDLGCGGQVTAAGVDLGRA